MKLKFLSIAFLAAGLMAAMSCEKEKITASGSKVAAPVKNSLVANVSIAASTGSFCGTTWPCGLESSGISMVNSIVTTNINQASYPSLVYTYYKYVGGNGVTEVYEPITGAQYTCDALQPVFAKTLLADNSKYLVIANDPSVTAPSMTATVTYSFSLNKINYNPGGGKFDFKRVITGNFYGDACGGSGGETF